MENTLETSEMGHMHSQPPTHDPVACRRWWQGLPNVAPAPWLHEEVGRRMQDRLQWIKMQARDWLHAQPSLGGWDAHGLIRSRYPKAGCQVTEPSARRMALTQTQLKPPWWRLGWPGRPVLSWLAPDVTPEPVDMLWANMQLHLHAEPLALLRQWHDALRVDGFLMFSCLGPDSLQELHQLYSAMGWPAPGPQWTDMHDWGDMLVQTGFSEPVMDMERITLNYATPAALLAELRTLGRNVHPQRHPSCRGKGWPAQLSQAMREHWPNRSQNGPYSLTFEIVYGHALKPKPRAKVDSTTRISLSEMKNLLRSG